MGRQTVGWNDTQTDKRNRQIQTDGRTDRLMMNRQTKKHTDGQTDGWINGRMYKQSFSIRVNDYLNYCQIIEYSAIETFKTFSSS